VSARFEESLATAIIGLDTLWGGDVMNPSGLGRVVADAWFSDEPLPIAHTHPSATPLRANGGVSAEQPDRASIDAYLAAVDIPSAIEAFMEEGRRDGHQRGAYLAGLAESCRCMWDLAMERIGRGAPVPYDACVRASCGADPSPSDPEPKRERLRELLAKAGHPARNDEELLGAVEEWRKNRLVPMASVRELSAAFIARLDAMCERHLAPFMPEQLRTVPRANITFLPVRDAWFSGFMNYLGRARWSDGRPDYEATYEINASLRISVPEFTQLVSHEVVPGHVTTFAYLQNLWWRKVVGFEASVPTMNTRAATLYEGIANNGILMAYEVNEVEELPDDDLQIGCTLALLQDDAKNQASYMIWRENRPEAEVAAVLRRECLVSEERAEKFSGSWGRHPLFGRMNLPAYRAGTEHVAELRRRHPPEKLIPVLFGARGLVDIVTIDRALGR
jgi:hypothetical protein